MKRRKVLFVHLSHIRLMVKKFAIVLLFFIAFVMMLFCAEAYSIMAAISCAEKLVFESSCNKVL